MWSLPNRGRLAGIALLEVLISVAILGFGLGVVMRTLGGCMRVQSRIEQSETVRRLAEQQVIDLLLSAEASQGGEMTGRFSQPFGAYSWRAISHVPAQEAPFVLLEFRVFREREGEQRLVHSTRALAW